MASPARGAQRLKSTFFEFFSNGAVRKGHWSDKKFKRLFILAFEINVQPSKYTFKIAFYSHFRALCVEKSVKIVFVYIL